MLSIVIPTMTPKLVSACVDSIAKYTDLDNIEIIVVANGCPPSFRAELDDQNKPLRYLWYDKPLGAVPALNAGIKAAKGKFIMLLNDDCEILDCPKNTWLAALLEPFSDPKMMCTGPFKMQPMLGEAGAITLGFDDAQYGFILFFMAVIRRQAFDEIGILDEQLQCGVDIDFCLKLKRKGYLIQQVPKDEIMAYGDGKHMCGSFPVWHAGEGTVHDYYGYDTWLGIMKKDLEILDARYGKLPKPIVSIVIPTFGDSMPFLTKCLDSVLHCTNLEHVEIVIVANGCPQEVSTYIHGLMAQYPAVKLKWSREALGATVALNVGIKASRGDVIVLLNHDVVVLDASWLSVLINPFMILTAPPDIGISTPHKGWISTVSRYAAMFYCAAIRRQVFDQIGYLDEKFNPGGFEDIDFSIRADNAGWRIVQVPDEAPLVGTECHFPIFHDPHHHTWMDEALFKRNADYLMEKHGEKSIKELEPEQRNPIINAPWSISQKQSELAMLQDFLGRYKIAKVLEVGSYRGGTTMVWAQMVAPHNGVVHAVDLKFDWRGDPSYGVVGRDGKAYYRQTYNDSPFERFVVEHPGDSHDKEHVKKVLDAAGKVDFMFIDGDHSYEGIKADFYNFLPAVKSGGFIAFHDIVDSPYHRVQNCYVGPFWLELKKQYTGYEFIDNNIREGSPSLSMGIGLIRVP